MPQRRCSESGPACAGWVTFSGRGERLQDLRAADGSVRRLSAKATLVIREASAREALETLGQVLDLEVRFAPGVPATNAISMRVQDAYVADAFHYVLNVSNLSLVSLDGRTATIAAKP